MGFNIIQETLTFICGKCGFSQRLNMSNKRIKYFTTKTVVFGSVKCKLCNYDSISFRYKKHLIIGKMLLKEKKKNENKKK